jgi:hypothetical protein
MQKYFFFLLCLPYSYLHAQVNGGEHVFNFLRLAQSPHVTALGGIVMSSPASDIMLSTSNPALLRPEFHTQLGLNYNRYYAGTRISNMMYAHHLPSVKTTLGLGIQYIDYGNFTATDDIGNVQGEVQARDYSINLTASRQYLERWRYAATLKWAHSRLADKMASALISDIGVTYSDTANQWYLGAAVKHAGIMMRNFQSGEVQPLPIDLQIGITKKFKKAPFSIMVLAHHLTQWDVRYDNPADRTDNTLLFADTSNTDNEKTYFADKLFRHLIFALDVHLGKRLEISAGYNHMRRAEMTIDSKKGMSGFSFGTGLYLNKFVVHVAQSYYHLAGAYTEFGMTMKLNQLFGLGERGQKINWSEQFQR